MYSPRISFIQIPGGTSDFRLDVLTLFLLFGFMIIDFLRSLENKFYDSYKVSILLIIAYLLSIFIFRGNPIYAIFQIMWYASILYIFYFVKKIFQENRHHELYLYLRFFIFINVMMHLYGVLAENYSLPIYSFSQIFPKYGIFNLPYAFALITGTFFLLAIRGTVKISKIEGFFLLLAIFYSESRVSFGAFIISSFIVASWHLRAFYLVSLPLIYIYVLSFIDLKALSILSSDFQTLITDPSLNVRLQNYYRYVEWLDIPKFLFGGGPLSYMEFSKHFTVDKAGPLDVLYLRVLSDFGIVASLFFIAYLSAAFIKNIKVFLHKRSAPMSILIFFIIYSFFNEGLLVIKSGHIAILIFAISFWDLKDKNTTL
tara:strand:- start:2235 stop:3347 length:1113 start_codon:yes stop_codon:yes gene_type:complete